MATIKTTEDKLIWSYRVQHTELVTGINKLEIELSNLVKKCRAEKPKWKNSSFAKSFEAELKKWESQSRF